MDVSGIKLFKGHSNNSIPCRSVIVMTTERKKLLLLNHKSQSLDISHEILSSGPLQTYSNYSPEVKIDPVIGVIGFPYKYLLKTFFFKTTRARAQINTMRHCLVNLYKCCSNYCRRVKICPALVVIGFLINIIIVKTEKKSPKLQGVELTCRYLT